MPSAPGCSCGRTPESGYVNAHRAHLVGRPGGGRADWWPDADRAIEAAEQLLLAEAGVDAPQMAVDLHDTTLMRNPGDRLYVLTQGSISMLDGAGRSADVIADSDAVVWSLTREAFDALIMSDPMLGERLTRNIAIHLSELLRRPK